MTPKYCTRCGKIALVSISFLLSTVNRNARKQKCGRATLLCDACIRDFLGVLMIVSPSSLYEHARDAYTQIGCDCDTPNRLARTLSEEKQPN